MCLMQDFLKGAGCWQTMHSKTPTARDPVGVLRYDIWNVKEYKSNNCCVNNITIPLLLPAVS